MLTFKLVVVFLIHLRCEYIVVMVCSENIRYLHEIVFARFFLFDEFTLSRHRINLPITTKHEPVILSRRNVHPIISVKSLRLLECDLSTNKSVSILFAFADKIEVFKSNNHSCYSREYDFQVGRIFIM